MKHIRLVVSILIFLALIVVVLINNSNDSSVEDRVFCNEESRTVDSCITLYDPVCGWNDPERIQCITFPCANTFSNSCDACKNLDTLYWTEGECPPVN